MLPKQYRLPLRKELLKIKKEGKLHPGKFFSLLVNNKGNENFSRFGFIISKKVHKKASKRNRVRRLLIESIRSCLPKIKPGFDYVFLAKKLIVDRKLLEIKKEVEKFVL